ncbi:MAG TPA: 3-deoxy-D-manno-octulosonic acid transferase, partial [Candidatus Binataceae bacterium]|nr:3-deoxy-D-manno-octulosonic acid transferase [Candidatus Binataceae bacterium]
IVARLVRSVPRARVVMTTMTPAGLDLARRRIPDAAAHMLAPLDCAALVRGFLHSVRPHLVIITETELWPNFFFEARRAGAKIAIINGRMSERSAGRYSRLGKLFSPALRCADLVMAQTNEDGARFASLGVAPERLHVTGNTKFDPDAASEMPIRSELVKFAERRPVLIAGSTAPGEDEILLDAYRRLRERFSNLALALAPRHLVRAPDVERSVANSGFSFTRASDDPINPRADILILDTMGELAAFYRCGTIAFVGGSLDSERGGQNPAEPAAAGIPVLIGPHHENQREMTNLLVQAGAARVVHDSAQLAERAEDWLSNDVARSRAASNARKCVEQKSGGVRASLEHLHNLIDAA